LFLEPHNVSNQNFFKTTKYNDSEKGNQVVITATAGKLVLWLTIKAADIQNILENH